MPPLWQLPRKLLKHPHEHELYITSVFATYPFESMGRRPILVEESSELDPLSVGYRSMESDDARSSDSEDSGSSD